MTDEAFERVIGVNVTGVWRVEKAMFPLLRRGGGGRTVLISSEVAMARATTAFSSVRSGLRPARPCSEVYTGVLVYVEAKFLPDNPTQMRLSRSPACATVLLLLARVGVPVLLYGPACPLPVPPRAIARSPHAHSLTQSARSPWKGSRSRSGKSSGFLGRTALIQSS